MSFSSVAGENGILDKASDEEPEPTHPEGSGRLRIRSKDMLHVREMPLPADPEANPNLRRVGNEEEVKMEVKFR